jgi:two-component system, chemotaxis family, CheB/CheR fusion protein
MTMKRTHVSTPPHNGELEELLEYLFERRNFDFRAYKRASLSRRIFKRMQATGVEDYQRYMEVLEANPGEFAELFNTILINVTSLLRDTDAWEVLAQRVIPAIVEAKPSGQPIRVWSAGVASGEEAYSLAVLFAEALGEERFRQTVKIYATDADSDALTDARHGRYREADLVAAFGEERTNRFFERDGTHGVFRGDLRRALIFGRHDLVQDPPISRIDLISCRNTLMYFTADVQAKVLTSFHFALNPGGYLFLGKSEALVTRTQMFEVVDLRQHIVRKGGTGTDIAMIATPPDGRPLNNSRQDTSRPADMAFEQSVVAQVVLDANATIIMANRAARRMFALGSAEIGRHLREVELSFRPADLRSPVDRVLRERRPTTIYDVSWHTGGEEPVSLDIVVSPLEGPGGVVLSFLDVSRYQHLREELEHSRRELETAYEELQSTVEELETTNEELQSTNEELETMNEELQSTNDELQVINEELRGRTEELDQTNGFLGSVLRSLGSAVIVLTEELRVRVWSPGAADLWGLRSEEAESRELLSLDIGLPSAAIAPWLRDILGRRAPGTAVTHVTAVNRRGKTVDLQIAASPMHAEEGAISGIILVIDQTAVSEPAASEPQS